MLTRSVFGLVLICSSLQAAGRIHDEAGIFTPAGIAAASEILDAIQKEFDVEVRIDTIEEIAIAPSRLAFWRYRSWLNKTLARNRADEANVNGLYVLIARQPRWTVAVSTWPAWRDQEVYTNDYQRRELYRQLERSLSTNPDKALRETLEQYRYRLRSARVLPPSPLQTLPALTLLAALIGLWLFLGSIRKRWSCFEDPPLYSSAVQGTLFGVPSSYWIYDRLYQVPQLETSAAATPDREATSSAPEVKDNLQ